MQVAKNKVVLIDYTLTDDDGEVIDTSEGAEPLAYLHGNDGLIPGLEKALEGKTAGDVLKVSVPPEEGYGDWDDELEQTVDRAQFEDGDDLEVGMQFQVDTDDGPRVFEIIEIEGDLITIDGNHALAGMNLNFDVTIREVRDATAEELRHGHVHGPGGHEH